MNSLHRCLSCFALLLGSLTGFGAHAATFNVTTSNCTGAGSISEAIASANAAVGVDTVSIQSGLNIDAVGCQALGASDPADNFMFQITESLIIEGEGSGAALDGNMAWVTASGALTPLDECPTRQTGTIIVANTPGFLVVGTRNQDNGAISVTVRNVSLSNLNALAHVWQNAELILEDVTVTRIFDAVSCDQPAIDVRAGANLRVLDSSFEDIVNWQTAINGVFGVGAITGSDAESLEIQGSRFNLIRRAGTISWIGGAGSTVDIVSTQIINSNGIVVLGDTRTNIVNSLISVGIVPFDDPDDADRIINGASEPMTIRGSTLLFPTAYCEPCDNGFTYPAYVQPLNGARIRLEGTAIGVNVPDRAGPGELLGSAYPASGRIDADPFSWIQPTAQQNAATLRALANQPGLLTDVPGLPVSAGDVYERATPLVEQTGTPGLLVDAIESAACGQANALVNPVDNSCIATDVLGKERVDANGRRAVGAVQVNLSPTARVASVGDGQVTVAWTRPPNSPGAPISGYRIQYRQFLGAPGWVDSLDVSGATTLSGTVAGLSRDAFEFRVLPLIGGVPEVAAASNVVAAIPYGPIAAPVVSATPGSGGAIVSWAVGDNGGHTLDHYVLAWKPQGAGIYASSLLVTHPTTSIGLPLLSNGVTYDIDVTAVARDGAQSGVGSTPVTPFAQASLAYPTPVTLYEGFSALLEPQVSGLSGTPVYTLVAGALPAGVSLDPFTGFISGTPAGGSSPGSPYLATIRLSQAGLPSEADVEVDIELNVDEVAEELTLHYPDIDVPVGTNVTARPTVTGSAVTGLTYGMVPGDSLPLGLSIDSTTGVISGAPTTATDGFQGLSVQVSNAGNASTAVSPLIVQIQPTVTYASANGIVGDPLTIMPNVSPSVVPGTFAVSGGVLPAGLSLDPSTGVISGTPKMNVFSVVTITYTQTGAQTQTVTVGVGIAIEGYEISATYPRSLLIPGQFLSVAPKVSGAKGAVTYTLSGVLPDGLSLDPATGVISGTPTPDSNALTARISVSDSYTRQVASAAFVVMPVARAVPVPVTGLLQRVILILLLSVAGSIELTRRRRSKSNV